MATRPVSPVARLSAAAGARLRSADTRLQVTARAGRATREITVVLAGVLLVGAGAATADPLDPPSARTAAATAVSAPVPSSAPPAQDLAGLAGRAPDLIRPAPKPALKPVPQVAAVPAPPPQVARWLPTGTGMWLHDWRRSESGHAAEVVARAKSVGLSHLYVQTGSSKKGWIGKEVLNQLMPATKGTGLQVIAWDFPKLIDPEADARRMARAAWWHRPGSPMVAAVAPDIETAAEGTRVSPDRVARYYKELRKQLPARTAILATVPWPSEKRTGSYPYATTAPYADAFIPMAYWYNRSPSVVTATSMTWLKRFGKPVMPVGQGYDGRLDAPYLAPDPAPDKSVAAFVYAARSHGAQSISLWSWQTTGAKQWGVLAGARGTVGPKPVVEVEAPVPSTPAAVPSADPQEEVTREDQARDAAPGRHRDRKPKDGRRGK